MRVIWANDSVCGLDHVMHGNPQMTFGRNRLWCRHKWLDNQRQQMRRMVTLDGLFNRRKWGDQNAGHAQSSAAARTSANGILMKPEHSPQLNVSVIMRRTAGENGPDMRLQRRGRAGEPGAAVIPLWVCRKSSPPPRA